MRRVSVLWRDIFILVQKVTRANLGQRMSIRQRMMPIQILQKHVIDWLFWWPRRHQVIEYNTSLVWTGDRSKQVLKNSLGNLGLGQVLGWKKKYELRYG